jgi:hypothetical protein
MNKIGIMLVAALVMTAGCDHHKVPSTDAKNTISKSKTDTIQKDTIDSENDDFPSEKAMIKMKENYIHGYLQTEHHHFSARGNKKEELVVDCDYKCLFDSAVKIPNTYYGYDTTNLFVTHSYGYKVIITKNKDTIFNRQFLKSDFDSLLSEELKKYAIIWNSPSCEGFDYPKNRFKFTGNITIPLTDVGMGINFYIDLNGNFTSIDNTKEN